MTMEEMQRQLARQQSRIDIMNLMGRYQYYHTGGEMSRIGRELFAYWLPDARCDIQSPLYPGAIKMEVTAKYELIGLMAYPIRHRDRKSVV